MGSIYEFSRWEPDIYRIQVTDQILGGDDGIINIQPSQLANRTAWLLEKLKAEHTDEGRHSVIDGMIAEDANIHESKLVLNTALTELLDLMTKAEQSVDVLSGEVINVIGTDGSYIQDLAKMVQLLWQYAEFGFAFDMFIGDLTLRSTDDIKVLTEAIANDDSLDLESNASLNVGQQLVMWDDNGHRDIVVKSILEKGRVRITEDLERNYVNATVGSSNWDFYEGYAIANPGKVYVSKVLYVLKSVPEGNLVIRRDVNGGELVVKYRDVNRGSAWTEVQLDRISENGSDTSYDLWYRLPGGVLQLKIEGEQAPTSVYLVAVFPSAVLQSAAIVRTPEVVEPADYAEVYRNKGSFSATKYRNVYRDFFASVEYRITNTETGERIVFRSESEDRLQPAEDAMPQPGMYTVQARHISDLGDCSAWSDAVNIIIKAALFYFGFANLQGDTAEYSKGFGSLTAEGGAEFYSLASQIVHFGFNGASDSAGFGAAQFVLGN